jgi:hypothetical protein
METTIWKKIKISRTPPIKRTIKLTPFMLRTYILIFFHMLNNLHVCLDAKETILLIEPPSNLSPSALTGTLVGHE